MPLYAVTDRAWLRGQTLLSQVEAAIRGGATCVQLREKELDHEAFLREALEMRELCKRCHIPLFINDDVEIAIACGADGVAVVSAIVSAPDPYIASKNLKSIIDNELDKRRLG